MAKYIFLLFFLFRKICSLSSTEPFELSSNRSLVSPGKVFELGLFKPDASIDRWYLGIWGRRFGEIKVWVANRENPLSKPMGTLKIFGANLLLLDQYGNQVWSTTNRTRTNPESVLQGELLDSGNFVLRYLNKKDSDGFLWQSFDFPTDSFVPDMKFGWDRKSDMTRRLTSWKTAYDPSQGNYTYTLEIGALPQSYIRSNGLPTLRIGPWAPGITKRKYDAYNVTISRDEVSFYLTMTNTTFFSIIKLSSAGVFEQSYWTSEENGWKLVVEYNLPADPCDKYNKCGPNGLCVIRECICIKGFEAIDKYAWDIRNTTGGCKRKTQLSCTRDGFRRLSTMKLPDTKESIVDLSIGLKECKDKCLKNCNCTAFANADGGSRSGCVIWVGGLLDLRKQTAGQDLFVRLAASDVG